MPNIWDPSGQRIVFDSSNNTLTQTQTHIRFTEFLLQLFLHEISLHQIFKKINHEQTQWEMNALWNGNRKFKSSQACHKEINEHTHFKNKNDNKCLQSKLEL